MNSSHKHKYSYFCTAACMLMISFAGYSEEALPAKPFEKIVLDEEYDFGREYHPYNEKDAERFASLCDENVVQALLSILANEESDYEYNKAKIAFFIGKTKDPKVFDVFVKCLERWLAAPINKETEYYIFFTITAIMFLGDERSADYLADMAKATYWEHLPNGLVSSIEGKTSKSLVRFYREHIIYTLSHAKNEYTIKILTEMETDPCFADLGDIIQSVKHQQETQDVME